MHDAQPHHHHHHPHDHDHDHDHVHRDPVGHGDGHNSAHPDHLHSHPLGGSHLRQEELQELTASFVENFRQATDKTSFLRLSGIPFQLENDGAPAMHLVDATIVSAWQIGTASPGFGSRELVYLPYPGSMVRARETMEFTYVSLRERRNVTLNALLADRFREHP